VFFSLTPGRSPAKGAKKNAPSALEKALRASERAAGIRGKAPIQRMHVHLQATFER